MSSLETWLVQLRQGSLSAAAFRQNVQEAVASGRLERASLVSWLQTPTVKASLPGPLVREIVELLQGQAGRPVAAGRSTRALQPGQAVRRPQAPGPASGRPGAGAQPVADAGEQSIGMVIDGRYELVARLGGGGMGEVFKALDRLAHSQHDPDPYVAIKILKARMQGSQKAILALQREANRARRLTHSNILRVHQFEQDRETGQYFMVMELLEGRPVESVMNDARGGQPWEVISPLIGQVCAGLTCAHEQGIIHSDIKPSNLFLTQRNEIKILDFGIATPLPSESRHETIMDARKLGARTPAYASMETTLGMKPHYSDDVFSLACLTYEWLAARPPYARPQDPKTPVPAPAALRLGLQPAPIPALSSIQNRALRKALSLRRGERTQTIDEFWKSMNEVPAAFPDHRSRFAAAVAGAVVAAIVGVSLAWLLPHRSTASSTVAAAPAASSSVGTASASATDASCPDPATPGALDTAVRAARLARTSLARLAAGSPQRGEARDRLSRSAQCLRTLAAAGLRSPASAQLLREIQARDAP
jgi:serine/threonine protein kinase